MGAQANRRGVGLGGVRNHRGSDTVPARTWVAFDVRVKYEAPPAGFVLARRLEAAGIDCLVCPPGLIPGFD
jgi:hypothetical protein